MESFSGAGSLIVEVLDSGVTSELFDVFSLKVEMGSMEANPLFHTGETVCAVSGRLQDSNRLSVPRRD